jgi:hypothetical protein
MKRICDETADKRHRRVAIKTNIQNTHTHTHRHTWRNLHVKVLPMEYKILNFVPTILITRICTSHISSIVHTELCYILISEPILQTKVMTAILTAYLQYVLFTEIKQCP